MTAAAPRLATLVAPDVAARWYLEMSPMGARAAGFVRAQDPDNAGWSGRSGLPASLARVATPFASQAIGSADIIVHGPGDIGMQSETSIAANADASVLIAGYNDGRGFPAPTNPDQNTLSLSGVSRSIDGGVTWAEVPVGPGGLGVLPTVTNASVYGDPDVKYDPVHNVFVYASIYVRPSDRLQGMCVQVSNADGSVWSAPREVTPSFILNHAADKEFIDINANTGRIMMTWTDFSTTNSNIRRAYSDDQGVTWSTGLNIASGSATVGLQSSIPRFLPAATNATSSVYAAWRVSTSTTRNIGVSRSTDGGVTWSAPVNIVAASYPVEDQIPGVDRVNTSPSMAVDYSTGRVYVVFQTNGSLGEGDIALRTFTGAAAAGTPVVLSSNPGLDRAQFFPWVTVDQASHRVHVIWYDQDVKATGDVMDLMHTYSDDGGATWSPPTPLFDRPFHAGYGNDTGQPNMGDYIQATAQGGKLHSLAAGTLPLEQFDEGEPGANQLFSPDSYYDQRLDSQQVASLRLGNVSFAELCAGGVAGALEPGETAALTFQLENYVTNATDSPLTYTGVSATLSSVTAGVTITANPQSFPDAAPGATVANAAPFLVKLDPGFVPGTYLDLVLTVSTGQGASIALPFLLPTGAAGTPVTLINEDFEGITPPALPAGWTAANGAGTSVPWVTSTSIPGGGTGSRAAFHTNTGTASNWMRLFSPIVIVPTLVGPNVPYVTLDFDIAYDTEDDPGKAIQAFDGAFLRLTDQTTGQTLRSVLAEAIAEQLKTGANHHYPKHLPRSSDTNYFEDMSVWAGYSNGFVHVSMKFPGAGMVGRSVQLRFEYTQDSNTDCTGAGHPGPCGVAIDNVVLKLVPTVGTFALQSTGTGLTSDVNPQAAGSPVKFTATVTPSSATGTVEFFDGATSIGTANVVSGSATLTTSSLTAGNHSMTAQYSGDACDAGSTSAPYSQDITGASGVDDGPVLAFALSGVSPNPVRDRARIGFALPWASAVDLRVLDVQGRSVATLAHGTFGAGRHEVSWNGRAGAGEAGAGMYFVRMRADGRTFVRRILVTR